MISNGDIELDKEARTTATMPGEEFEPLKCHGDLLSHELKQESTASRLLNEVYEHPIAATAIATGVVLVAGGAGLRYAMINSSRRSAIAALSPNVFYIESKIPGQIAEKSLNQGTGFLVSKSGHVATAYHVVKDAGEITVFNKGGRDFTAKLVGFDAAHDVALLKLEGAANATLSAPVMLASPPSPTFLRPARSFVLGHPNESVAQVSASGKFLVERTITGLEARTFKRPEIEGARQLVMDLEVLPGFSGAPLADLKGRVFGIVTEGKLGTRSSHGAPISKLQELMSKLIGS